MGECVVESVETLKCTGGCEFVITTFAQVSDVAYFASNIHPKKQIAT